MGGGTAWVLPDFRYSLGSDSAGCGSTMLAPHLAAVWLAFRGRAFWSGVLAGVAFLINTKAMFVLAACAVWCFPAVGLLAAGFLVANAVAAAWMAWSGALVPYINEVWRWGLLYAGSTFLEHPVRDGFVKTADWFGFHSALVVAAVWNRDSQPFRWKLIAWAAISLAAAVVGWRFFPRYFFQVLPVLVIAASRGIVLMKRWRVLVLALLLIPLIRFGPRYVLLASGRAGRVEVTLRWTRIVRGRRARCARSRGRTIRYSFGDSVRTYSYTPICRPPHGLSIASRSRAFQRTGISRSRRRWERISRAPIARNWRVRVRRL